MRILIVEDEKHLADSLSCLLKSRGFSTEVAYDGDTGAEEETKLQRVREFYGKGAESMLEEFRKAYPKKDINDLMYVDSRFRKPAINYIAARVQVAKAPTYSWMLTYDFCNLRRAARLARLQPCFDL